MSRSDEHTVATPADKWQYTCPQGHRNWRVWNSLFGCRTCKQHRDAGKDVDSVYEYLIDQRTGERVTRDELTIKHAPARDAPSRT